MMVGESGDGPIWEEASALFKRRQLLPQLDLRQRTGAGEALHLLPVVLTYIFLEA